MNSSTQTDKFSWRRAWQFGLIYRTPLTKYAIFMLVLSTLSLAMICVWPWAADLCMVIIGIASSLLPLSFATKDKTVIRLAPVTAGERLAAYMLGIVVIESAVNLWYAIVYVLALYIEPLHPIIDYFRMDLTYFAGSRVPFPLLLLGYGTLGLSILIIVLEGVITSRKHPVWGGVWSLLKCYIALIILSFVAGFSVAFMGYDDVKAINEIQTRVLGLFLCVAIPWLIGAIWRMNKYLK